jgi:hypothetical protein
VATVEGRSDKHALRTVHFYVSIRKSVPVPFSWISVVASEGVLWGRPLLVVNSSCEQTTLSFYASCDWILDHVVLLMENET